MASGGRIKGITVEIGGDVGPLSAALKGVNGTIRETGSQLKDVNRLLKLDPTNVELLGQKAGVAQKERLTNIQQVKKTCWKGYRNYINIRSCRNRSHRTQQNQYK